MSFKGLQATRLWATRLVSLPKLAMGRSTRQIGTISRRLDEIVEDIAMKEAVRYKENNLKWTRGDVKKHSDAFASGILTQGMRKGQVMAIWMPECPEKLVSQLAAARIGLIVADIDYDIKDPDMIGEVLDEMGVKMLVYEPGLELENEDILAKAIPEYGTYSKQADEWPFRSWKYLRLKFFIHAGTKIVDGSQRMRDLLLYDLREATLAEHDIQVDDDKPFNISYTLDSNGKLKKNKVETQKDVFDSGRWPILNSILQKKYIEV